MDVYNLVSFVGLFVLMALAWCVSTDRRRMNWRAIAWGVVLQLMLGALVFRAPGSRAVFSWLNRFVEGLLEAATAGGRFVFGDLAVNKPPWGFVLATQALPTIIFFSAVMALLYYWRIMPAIVRGFSWLFTRLMRISGAESLCTASNIFVGIESATTVRPYLREMTRSELCTVLTAGMATIASSVLGFYWLILHETFP
ncbi:MAG TPA: Na+ dependent nucleoside transporter N-terminal domain-containing protein, partial [Planctomycetota bacterium]|nr:Na+ dependent nucleoside transporter N-terminal domain-containing protein [Planctomycetota bacterium]